MTLHLTQEWRDIAYAISLFVSGEDLIHLTAVCKVWRSLDTQRMWKGRISRDFYGPEGILALESYGLDKFPPFWKKEYLRIWRSYWNRCALCDLPEDEEDRSFLETAGRFYHLRVGTAIRWD